MIELKERYNTFFKYNTIKFSDPIEWDITRQYPPFMIVFDTQNESSYISKRPVPAGITLDNSDFWEYIGSLLVDGYARLMIERVMKSISGNFESTLVCTQNRIDGDFIVIAGDIFKATSNITVGQPYVVGLNVVKVTIEDMIESFIDDTLDINSTHAISNRAVTNMFNSIQEIISSYDSQLVDMEHDIDNIETEISSVNVNLNNRINTTNSNLSQTAEALATETANRQSADNVLNSRINAIASLQQGSTTGDAELIDGRIGANGTTYQNIGSAIRGQIEPLNRVINNLNLNTGSTLEMGNITASDGSDIPSTKNFRLAGYLNPAVHTIKCEAWYQMALATYTPAGTFMNRSAFQYQTISNLDHVHYKYRVVFKMVNDDDIPAPDTVGTHFISEASELENNKSVYNDTLSIDIPFEQGNISAYDGSNVSSTTNIRSIYYIPNTVKSISADPGYVMAVSRRLKSDLSFVDRTNYNVTFYDTFDFDTYL